MSTKLPPGPLPANAAADAARMAFLAEHWQSMIEGRRLHDWLGDIGNLMKHGSLRKAIDHARIPPKSQMPERPTGFPPVIKPTQSIADRNPFNDPERRKPPTGKRFTANSGDVFGKLRMTVREDNDEAATPRHVVAHYFIFGTAPDPQGVEQDDPRAYVYSQAKTLISAIAAALDGTKTSYSAARALIELEQAHYFAPGSREETWAAVDAAFA